MKVVVIGAGIGGLAAAAGLQHQGIDVTVLERAEQFTPAGSGLSLFGNGFRALDALGLGSSVRQISAPGPFAGRAGIRVPSGRWLSKTNEAATKDLRVVDRSALHDVLLSALTPGTVQTGSRVQSVHEDEARLTDGRRVTGADVVVGGILLISAGLVLMALLVSTDGGYLTFLPGMLTLGLGMGLAMTPSTEAITSSLPRDQQGLASALNDVTREFGTAIGVALLGAVLTAGYRTSISTQLDGIPADVAEPAREGVANAIAAADALGTHKDALVRAAQDSFVEGWQHAMWAGAAVMAALFAYVLVRGPHRDANTVVETDRQPAPPEVVTR